MIAPWPRVRVRLLLLHPPPAFAAAIIRGATSVRGHHYRASAALPRLCEENQSRAGSWEQSHSHLPQEPDRRARCLQLGNLCEADNGLIVSQVHMLQSLFHLTG